MGKITTHILDTSQGKPAEGVAIRLFSTGDDRQMLAYAKSNTDGRTERPMLQGELFTSGTYELEFEIGDYFRDADAAVDSPAFLDTVVIRFSVDASQNYHVPLLATPWSYSTYRGS